MPQIYRQELENRRAAIHHQQQQYGEGQELDGGKAPELQQPPAKRQRVGPEGGAADPAAPADGAAAGATGADSPRRRQGSSEEDD